MENTNPNTPPTLVQHVAKSSSDQLLRKFAEVSPDDKIDLRLAKRLKASQATHKKMMMMMMKKNESESESGCGRDCNKSSRRRRPTTGLSEGKSLLLPCSCTCNNKRRLGGDIKNRYIISAIKKVVNSFLSVVHLDPEM